MILTSDLDRTLVFSKKMIKLYPFEREIAAVERKGDKEIAFMSRQAIDLLRQFMLNHTFIPVTTRTVHQYQRIHLFEKELKPKFAVTSNGGNILIDGKVDESWHFHIKELLSQTACPKEDVLKFFASLRHGEWVKREFLADHLFYVFYIEEEKLPVDSLADFRISVQKYGWTLFLQGRKLYLLPERLNKAYAVSKLANYLDFESEFHAAAGDSLMDFDMLKSAHAGFSPIHGELFEKIPQHDAGITWINEKGLGSVEVFLKKLLDKADKEQHKDQGRAASV